MKTEKLYYENPFQTSCEAFLVKKVENGLIFNKTVAFPEGGGQIGDVGTLIRCKDNSEINFHDTTKIGGRDLSLKNFPKIKVESQIMHHVDNNEILDFEIGEKFIIKLDSLKRAQIILHHSALHLVLMVLEEMFPGIDKKIIGARITDKYGRLDFAIDYKFAPEILSTAENICNKYIDNDIPTEIFTHPDEKEALYWRCNDYTVPCGGTHCKTTKDLKGIKLKRKSIGRSAERLIVEVPINEAFNKLYSEVNQ